MVRIVFCENGFDIAKDRGLLTAPIGTCRIVGNSNIQIGWNVVEGPRDRGKGNLKGKFAVLAGKFRVFPTSAPFHEAPAPHAPQHLQQMSPHFFFSCLNYSLFHSSPQHQVLQ